MIHSISISISKYYNLLQIFPKLPKLAKIYSQMAEGGGEEMWGGGGVASFAPSPPFKVLYNFATLAFNKALSNLAISLF